MAYLKYTIVSLGNLQGSPRRNLSCNFFNTSFFVPAMKFQGAHVPTPSVSVFGKIMEHPESLLNT
jgi:hypothetical protein